MGGSTATIASRLANERAEGVRSSGARLLASDDHLVGAQVPRTMASGVEDNHEYDAPEGIVAWVSAIAPDGTAFAVDRIGSSVPFDAAEEAAVAMAVDHRRDEFHTGRRLAREALAQLGCPATSLPPDGDRVPRWPTDFVGTISHSRELCVALVGRASQYVGIGIDIEKIARIEPGLEPLICRTDELELERTGWTVDQTSLRFVAKEAFFKAYFPATRTFLEFLDVRVVLDPASARFEALLMEPGSPSLYGSRAFAGHFATLGGHIAAAVWIPR